MDFIGSKVKLNKWMFDEITKVASPNEYVFLDACCGSGTVSRHAVSLKYEVVANDIMAFPRAVANGSIGLTDKQKETVAAHIEQYNILDGEEGFFYNNLSIRSKPSRRYFTAQNSKIIDQVRKKIDSITDDKVKDCLLYCGIEALSRVSNTAGTHGAFLRIIKPRAKERFELRMENIVDGKVTAYSKNILNLLNDSEFKQSHPKYVLYIDPPYTGRQYPSNYHLYETFVKNDNPSVTGLTGLRPDWQTEAGSDFCRKAKCLDFLKQVVGASTADYVFMSYSTDGLLKAEDIELAFPNRVSYVTKDQRRYKADTSDNRTYNDKKLEEYLFTIKAS